MIVVVLTAAALAWFGPAQASFEARLPGNPYDFHVNDVRVAFVAADGHREERLAFYDDGHWKAWLATTHPATYEATLMRNGEPVDTPAVRVTVADTARLPGAYVRVQGLRFTTDEGTPYFPIGHNLGWQQPATPTLLMQLREMGAAGMNWTRIWACAWDGKNPFYRRNHEPPPPGELLPEPLRQWDEIFAAAEDAGVRLQLVLFHHGLFSSEVNPNWDEHPWNAANGGFLARAQDFFTDATARDYSQRWLRHAVARWGHSRALLAWELFNEVEWVDRVRRDHDWPAVAAWHADMAAFLRAIDPYRHLVTTSSAVEHPALYSTMDYYQPHLYTRHLTVAIAGREPLPGKPWFFGEFGGDAFGPAASDESSLVRDGLWASILAGHAGAAGYWYWDRVAQHRLASEFTRAARGVELARLGEREATRPVAVEISGTRPAPFRFTAGHGWPPAGAHYFALPEDVTISALAKLSNFLRGPDPQRPHVVPTPLELRFTALRAAEATIGLQNVGTRGAGFEVLLDGAQVFLETWAPSPVPAGGTSPARAGLPEVTVPYAAGEHVLTLRSTGPDWVQFGTVTIPNLGKSSHAMALGNDDFVLCRLTSTAEGMGSTLALRFPGLRDGDYTLTRIDLTTGAEAQSPVQIRDSTLTGWAVAADDVVFVITR